MSKLRAALVIARRDYLATVWSRAFLLFLIGPLFPIVFGVIFGSIGADMGREPPPPSIAIIARDSIAADIDAAHGKLSSVLGDRLVAIRIEPPRRDEHAQVQALLREPDVAAVLSDPGDAPMLIGPPEMIDRYEGETGLILREARRNEALRDAHRIVPEVKITRHAIGRPPQMDRNARQTTARGGQMVLVVLTMILAGMLLSNLIEEKSNKVIEVLAAAVPVDAIFFGKLIAMLGMSLTGIAVWGTVATTGIHLFAPQLIASLAAPAIGWPVFILLGIVYFTASYLLLGAVFLGIGAQASTVREVQTLSMPVTMGQLGVFGLASAAVGNASGRTGMIATLFPWSSPFAMIARAAELPQIWPHLLAIGWQALWVALIIRIGSRLFRRSVLKSGGARLGFRRGRS